MQVARCRTLMMGIKKKELDWILGEKSSQQKLQICLRRKDKLKVPNTHLYSKYLIPLDFFCVCLLAVDHYSPSK